MHVCQWKQAFLVRSGLYIQIYFLLNQIKKQVKLKLQIICNMYKSIKTTLVAFIAKFA